MSSGAASILPIFLYFGIGVALRMAGIVNRDHAQLLLRLVFFVTLPALAFLAITGQEITPKFVWLPLLAVGVNLFCLVVSMFYVRRRGIDRGTAGSVVLGASMANVTFVIPFIDLGLGPSALAAIVLFDAGNALFVATGSNYVAHRFGGNGRASALASLIRISRTPLLLAVLFAFAVILAGWKVPAPVEAALQPLANTTAPLVLIALGALFTTDQLIRAPALACMAFRMIGGLVAGLVGVYLLGLTGPAAVAIIAAAAAPIGFNVVTLASITRLDVDTASSALFLSVLAGLFTTTLILLVGGSALTSPG